MCVCVAVMWYVTEPTELFGIETDYTLDKHIDYFLFPKKEPTGLVKKWIKAKAADKMNIARISFKLE